MTCIPGRVFNFFFFLHGSDLSQTGTIRSFITVALYRQRYRGIWCRLNSIPQSPYTRVDAKCRDRREPSPRRERQNQFFFNLFFLFFFISDLTANVKTVYDFFSRPTLRADQLSSVKRAGVFVSLFTRRSHEWQIIYLFFLLLSLYCHFKNLNSDPTSYL